MRKILFVAFIMLLLVSCKSKTLVEKEVEIHYGQKYNWYFIQTDSMYYYYFKSNHKLIRFYHIHWDKCAEGPPPEYEQDSIIKFGTVKAEIDTTLLDE